MPVKGFINVGKQVDVQFTADQDNTGTVAVASGWVPDATPHPVPQPQVDTVAPGASSTHSFRVPQAFQLRITLDLPDGGSGTLAVRQDGTTISSGTVSSDTIWSFMVA